MSSSTASRINQCMMFVGTTNIRKIDAVRIALINVQWPSDVVSYHPSSTTVPSQPFEEQTRTGAKERANAKLNVEYFDSKADFEMRSSARLIYHLGIESGLFYDQDTDLYYDQACICINSGIYNNSKCSNDNQIIKSGVFYKEFSTEKVYIPQQYTHLVKKCLEDPTHTFGELLAKENSSVNHDNWHKSELFGGKDRYDLIREAIVTNLTGVTMQTYC